MRVDSKGLWWNEVDQQTEKKETFLIEEGWLQVFSGFWAEEWRINQRKEIGLISFTLDNAYKEARASYTGEKRTPPDPVWLATDYLPGLEEAQQFDIPLLTDQELVELSLEGMMTGNPHKLVFDVECFGNYFLIAFMSITLEKVVFMELSHKTHLDIPKLTWVLQNFCVVGFNSRNYDMIITALAVKSCSTAQMKAATTSIIEHNKRGWEVLRHYKAKGLKIDHIDLIEVAPLFASLKIYGGRMHTLKMQGLPFDPNAVLTDLQVDIVRWYCINDLQVTRELYQKVKLDITLRESMGVQYRQDLRSKSDAQIAEAVIGAEVVALNGCKAHRPVIEPGTSYHYQIPDFIRYSTPLMNGVLNIVRSTPFVVSEYGNVGLPQELKDLKITINQSTYRMGIGGLHSTEKKAAHFSTPEVMLKDVDVVSYYPWIILILELFPHQLGANFLQVYRDLVITRVAAKRAGDKRTANSLKIVVNGSFGKLGSKYSILYSPDLLIQVTITGQLSLLMLIERLELANIPVVSANTDGIVIKCPRDHEANMNAIVKQWEIDTGFETEEALYAALLSRDVNNYLAIKEPSTWKEGAVLRDKVKTKGIFVAAGLSKNPQNEICIDAILELLLDGIPLQDTIRECKNITKFLNVRTVKGGAVKLDENGQFQGYLGKAIRWYYAQDERGEIVYAKSGNKVPKSDGARPLMDIPEQFPNDIDFEWYERESMKILKGIDFHMR